MKRAQKIVAAAKWLKLSHHLLDIVCCLLELVCDLLFERVPVCSKREFHALWLGTAESYGVICEKVQRCPKVVNRISEDCWQLLWHFPLPDKQGVLAGALVAGDHNRHYIPVKGRRDCGVEFGNVLSRSRELEFWTIEWFSWHCA